MKTKLLAVVAIAALSLAGCAGTNADTDKDSKTDKQVESTDSQKDSEDGAAGEESKDENNASGRHPSDNSSPENVVHMYMEGTLEDKPDLICQSFSPDAQQLLSAGYGSCEKGAQAIIDQANQTEMLKDMSIDAFDIGYHPEVTKSDDGKTAKVQLAGETLPTMNADGKWYIDFSQVLGDEMNK